MMINPLGQRPKGDPQKVAQIKQWIAENWQLEDNVAIMVTELQCSEPGCPPVETVIALLGKGQPRQHKIFKPMAEVAQSDVMALAAPTEEQ